MHQPSCHTRVFFLSYFLCALSSSEMGSVSLTSLIIIIICTSRLSSLSLSLSLSLSAFPQPIGLLTSCCVDEHWEFLFRPQSKPVHDRKKISNWLIFNLLNAKPCSTRLCTNGPRLDNSCKALEITEILYCWMRGMITGQKKTSFCQSTAVAHTVCLQSECFTGCFMLENMLSELTYDSCLYF